MTKFRCILLAHFFFILTFMYNVSFAQTRDPYVRIAKIIVDSTQLENYKAALKEGIETAVRLEPGVLRMYAVYDKNKPTHVTVFETYASKQAYESHIQTPHFKKYKTGTGGMVKSLELVDVIPIVFEAKKQQ
ncbi:putative quinol monooxygenase [Niastella vici]|nr:putative quinol monooxygenase [Niastella vici]